MASLRLGIDLGSVAVHLAVVEPGGEVLWGRSRAYEGAALPVLGALVDELVADLGGDLGAGESRRDHRVRVGLTGGARDLLGEGCRGAVAAGEVVAGARGAAAVCPGARSVIEIGGQLSRWMALADGGSGELVDFSLSQPCAAGAGVFLEQQAGRLGLEIAGLASLAAGAPRGAAVAGRCAVFAKTDMIHLQQKGTPVAEIAFGLCLALVRNLQATLLRGKRLRLPLALIGGGALNQGVVRAVRQVFALERRALVIPDPPTVAAAVGAALLAAGGAPVGLDELRRLLRGHRAAPPPLPRLPALEPPLGAAPEAEPGGEGLGETAVVLGVDVGSVSTNLALVTVDGRLVDGVYLRTRGRPLEAVREGLAILHGRHRGRILVLGAGATGSGRHLAGWLIGADEVRNEITAQLRAAVAVLPDVDTVLEIGGQDSKYIQVRDGHIVDFTMNKICAAGTGSFLEEQAERLGIRIEEEFAERALRAPSPVDLGSRCTVFMDSEVARALRHGAASDDIVAGLALSVVRNYLDRVVAGRPIGRRVFFQGGTASNRAVVAALEQSLGRPVQVHPWNRLSGAVGAALLVLDRRATRRPAESTRFKGFTACSGEIDRSFECPLCSNRCQVNRLRSGAESFFFGDTCERYTSKAAAPAGGAAAEDHLAVMEAALLEEAGLAAGADGAVDPTSAVGIPRAGLALAWLPVWAALVRAAGRQAVLSAPSSPSILAAALGDIRAETCLPVKMAHGHVRDLLARGVRTILLPSVLSVPPGPADSSPAGHTCPYTHYLPFMVRAALGVELLAPRVELAEERILEPEGLAARLGIEPDLLQAALAAGLRAQERFRGRMRALGRQLLARRGDRLVVVLGKPYNLLDPFLNLGLGRHLVRLGLPFMPMECLPLDEVSLDERWSELPWGTNRDYVRAALFARDDPRLFPLAISSFGCGPDGFTVRHLEALLENRPQLVLEVDEHRAEAGLITRLEAFADEIDAFCRRRTGSAVRRGPARGETRRTPASRRYFLPHFADHVHAYAGALRRAGHEAVVLPPPDEAKRRLGARMASGRECHVFSILAGDLSSLASAGGSREGDAFLFPGTAVPCLLPQYRDAMLHGLRGLAPPRIDVVTPHTTEHFSSLLGFHGLYLFWQGLVAVDLLLKAACSLRPYELEPGRTDAVHRANLRRVEEAVESGGLEQAVRRAGEDLAAIAIDRSPPRPAVGVAGDVYTRVNGFASDDLFRRLESLGCEVWPAPTLVDTVDFTASRWARQARRQWRIRELLTATLLEALRHHAAARVRGALVMAARPEPTYAQVLAATAPYAPPEANYLALLNLSKMIDFARHGASGVVNAICLNCMVGTISASLLDRLRADHDDVPMTTLVYGDGTGGSGEARLEAFAHQVHRYHARRREASGAPSIARAAT
ncbi:MAG: acyl-CoA dehydratase activase [Acidobacteriota bacterium]|nr:acyl-CoA dehydratase activase [Acidobacteriota bacterium]MDH3522100.1 acyl-CoA dehydratase activase [Acidobacteriota bacterium]